LADPKRIHRLILEFALGLPEAYEDHPWDETVVKVAKKVFVFLGSEESPLWPAMTVKLGDLVEESYRLVAPKRLVAKLDQSGLTSR
jgi:predicted DNA-binding protein (MmcQ/YjbR family)